MRRFLGRLCKHNNIHVDVINLGGLFPRQVKAVMQSLESVIDAFSTGMIRGEIAVDKKENYASLVFDVQAPIESASVRDMRIILGGVVDLCHAVARFSTTERLNLHVLRSCPDYTFRGAPFSISDDPWYVGGRDLRGGSGVLEWCADKDDAVQRLKIMSKYKRFQHLVIARHADDMHQLAA